jgi:hypothetical protein
LPAAHRQSIANVLAGAVSQVARRVARIGAEGVIRRSSNDPTCRISHFIQVCGRTIGIAMAKQTQTSMGNDERAANHGMMDYTFGSNPPYELQIN